jgi:hypothetical protein
MTYAFPAWEFSVDIYLLKLQRLQNKVFRTIGNFPRRTSVHDIHVALKILYVMTSSQNYAGSKQKPYKITRIQLFAT